mgnify:CR=1 FL=1
MPTGTPKEDAAVAAVAVAVAMVKMGQEKKERATIGWTATDKVAVAKTGMLHRLF